MVQSVQVLFVVSKYLFMGQVRQFVVSFPEQVTHEESQTKYDEKQE